MLFDTVLIANRGEIAVRIIKACRKLDLKTVAVFSDADRDALFVRMADQGVHLGEAPATSSYLDMDKIIHAAGITNAGAIHPGYGFLAENAEFAQKCRDVGLIFIGPKTSIIRKMGSKIEAKDAAITAGVPVVPGYHAIDCSKNDLVIEAKKIGTPLMIKASAGGGGRGMRLIHDLDKFEGELELAKQEAASAFGDPSLLLERYIENARHIEVQVLGDGEGNLVHLFERDCSIQRNHQKIIEEAPAPNLPSQVRQQMFDAALSLCNRIGYDSAGTVEFIYEPGRQEFYFLEMNTRLQVEHPVTEAITGVDLVEWQLRIAMGEIIPFGQEDIHCKGWAMEARVAAENPAEGYMPETGKLTKYEEPSGQGVRVDSGVQSQSEVSHHYDSMLAKVIIFADNRPAAIRRLRRAITSFKISGVKTNIEFLQDVLELGSFKLGEHHTLILQQEFSGEWQRPVAGHQLLATAALAGYLKQSAKTGMGPWRHLGAWRIVNTGNDSGKCYFDLKTAENEIHQVQISGSNGTYKISLNDENVLNVSNAILENGRVRFEKDAVVFSSDVELNGHSIVLHSESGSLEANLLLPEQMYLGKKDLSVGGGDKIVAPMPGLVVDVLAKEGQSVQVGETLVILEAMKLMQELRAPVSGIVSTIHYKVGDTPEKGSILLSIDTDQETA